MDSQIATEKNANDSETGTNAADTSDYQLQCDVDVHHIAADIKKQQQQQQQQQRRNAIHTHSPISSYSYNDIVQLDDQRLGKIKFIGALNFDSDIWIGLILQSPSGSHDGTVKSRTYWRCPSNHGTFVRNHQIKAIHSQRIGARFSINTKVRTPRGKGLIRYIGTGPLNGINTNSNSNPLQSLQPLQQSTTHILKEEAYHEDREQDTSDHLIYGVELLDQIGENSGSVGGDYYFTCAHCRGMFFNETELVWIPPDAPPTPKHHSRSHHRNGIKSVHRKRKRNDELISPALRRAERAEQKKMDKKRSKIGSMEIIGLDEENQSIDIDSVVDDEELHKIESIGAATTLQSIESQNEFEHFELDRESENGLESADLESADLEFEDFESTDLESSASNMSTMESLSDSSSDEEYFSSADIQRISLMVGGEQFDDRMSFARILSDFKYVQKVNSVKSMAQRYESYTKKQRFSTSKLSGLGGSKRIKSEAEKAQEIINREKRRRGLSNGTTPPITSVYSPPRFADSVMNGKMNGNKSRFKRKRTAPYNATNVSNVNYNGSNGTRSVPVSPRITPMKRGDSAPAHPHTPESIVNSIQSAQEMVLIKRQTVNMTRNGSKSQHSSSSFKKILPPNTRKRSRKRKVHFDEMTSTDPNHSISSPLISSPLGAGTNPGANPGSISSFCLSPSASTQIPIVEESPDIEQELIQKSLKLDKSRNSEEFIKDQNWQKVKRPSRPQARRGKSVPLHPIQSPLSPSSSGNSSTMSSTMPSQIPHMHCNISVESNRSSVSYTPSVTSMQSNYAAPAMITPGGGIPDLQLRNSISSDDINEDTAAVVEEIHNEGAGDLISNDSNDHNVGVPGPSRSTGSSVSSTSSINGYGPFQSINSIPSPITTEETSTSIMSPISTRSRSLSPSSWIFKPAEDSQSKALLKSSPDCPFDIASTAKDFQKVSELLMLECNNPKNLFKVLKGIAAKLKFDNATYRRIDTQDAEVRGKLLRFEGAEEFLNLLGFEQINNNHGILDCELNQPPLSVLDAAIGVCNDCLLKCNQKRATIDMIKKFGRGDLKKGKKRRKSNKMSRKKKGAKGTKPRNDLNGHHHHHHHHGHGNVVVITPSSLSNHSMDTVNEMMETPTSGTGTALVDEQHSKISRDHSFELDLDDTDSLNSNVPNFSSLQLPSLSLNSRSVQLEDATDTLTMDDLKFEEELDGEEDRFQLSDIVWSITHKNNHDKEARAIILLCFPTFSDSKKLIKCLIERFFEPDDSKQKSETDVSSQTESSVSLSGGDESSSQISSMTSNSSRASTPMSTSGKYDFVSPSRIESLWEVQAKVVSFLQQWMRTYWAEDWDGQEAMLEIVEQFSTKIEECYTSDPVLNEQDQQKGLVFVKMLNQTMRSQEALLKSRQKKRNLVDRQTGKVPNKFEKLSEMSTAISQMRYNFIKLDNRRLAEQITLCDFKYFKAIQKRECLGQAWKKANKYERAANICALIDQFNKMSKWVQCTILLAKNVKQRGRLIKKFIKVMNELLTLRNFQSLCAFHGALSSVPVHKLKDAWSYVPAKHVARFQEMKVIFNTRNNMGNLRKLHREALVPLVPYTGIFLSDLVSIEEGNKKHKDDGTVNFAKLMRLSNAIDNILLYQSSQYNIVEDQAVQSLLLEDFKINEKLDADYIYKFAADVARKDQPRKKKSMLKLFKTSSAK